MTAWEAEIDWLINQQAVAATDGERKKAVDRVQQIVADQQPFTTLFIRMRGCFLAKTAGSAAGGSATGADLDVEQLRLQGAR